MVVLITGAGGLIGSRLARHFRAGHRVLALKHAELDITDGEAGRRLVLDVRPSLIINCATVEVDDCERHPDLARAVHVDGPSALAASAARVGAEFVHFSTNYVFGGAEIGRGPYTIEDEPRPINLYGRLKVAGEKAVREACARAYLIRTSWVYGPGKKTFLCTVRDDLKAGKRVRAVTDIRASTTYVEDLIFRLAEILALGHHGTYHVINGGACTYFEFAREAGRLLDLGEERLDELIESVAESDIKRLAPRPRYTPMRCLLSEELGFAPMRDWRAALADYVRS